MKSYTRLALFLLILLLSVGMLSTAINILGDITELDLEEDVPGVGESTLGPGGLTKGGGEAIPIDEPNPGNLGPIFEIVFPPKTKYLRRMVANDYEHGFWHTVDEGEHIDYYGQPIGEFKEPLIIHQEKEFVIFQIAPLKGNLIRNWAPVPSNVEFLTINNTLRYFPLLDLFRITTPINDSYGVFYKKYEFTNLTFYNSDPSYFENVTRYPSYLSASVKELAEQITDGKDSAYEKYVAIEAYLKENYEFDEDFVSTPSDMDPVEWFLFHHKRGIASHFNTAFIILSRSIGLPSRAVMGFIISPDKDYQLVFPQNAHLFAEVPFKELGWITFDATPQRIEEENAPGEALSTITNITGNDRVALKGGNFSVWGWVRLENGTGADGAQVEILLKVDKFDDDEAGIQCGLGEAQLFGLFNISCEASPELEVGDYQLVAHTLPSRGYGESWSDPPIRIMTKLDVNLTSDESVYVGKRATFSAIVIDSSNGEPVAEKDVLVNFDETEMKLETDSRGRVYFRHTFKEEGGKNITFTVPESKYYLGKNSSLSIDVQIPPSPSFLSLLTTFPYSILLVGSIAIVIGLIFALGTRRNQPELITVQLKPPLDDDIDFDSPLSFRTYEEGVVKLFNRFFRKAKRTYPEIEDSLTPREFEYYLLTKIPSGSEFALDDLVTSFEVAEYGNMKLGKTDFDRCEATVQLMVELIDNETGD